MTKISELSEIVQFEKEYLLPVLLPYVDKVSGSCWVLGDFTFDADIFCPASISIMFLS
jgi:hypothetical protein